MSKKFIELPYKIFSLNNDNGEKMELILTDTFDYPDITSFWGGYDLCGILNLEVYNIKLQIKDFYFTTSDFYNFLDKLITCYENLSGKAEYKPTSPDSTSTNICIDFNTDGSCFVACSYKDDTYDNNFDFHFGTNQSYINQAINELKDFRRNIQ